VRVVIADDSVIVREGIASILTRAGIEVAAQASDPGELHREVDAHRPDVAIVDIRMPPTHTDEGLRAAHELRARHPGIGILILSQYVEVGIATRLLAEDPESLGYVLKDRVADVDEFVAAVRRVAAGGTVLDPEVVAGLVSGSAARPLDRLTDREREVLTLMAEGRSNAAIAARLFVSEKAVGKHTNAIFTKLDLPPAPDDNRRVLAVLAWLDGGG